MLRPKESARAVGALFRRRVPALETITLVRGGKPLATGRRRV